MKKGRPVTNISYMAILLCICGQIATGCSEPAYMDMNSQPTHPRDVINRYISSCENIQPAPDRPLIIVGKPMPDVSGRYKVSKGTLLVAEPSQTMETLDVVIDDIKYVVVLEGDGVVHSIFTNDAKLRDPEGIGVGSTFAGLKKKYANFQLYYYQYMYRYVDVGNGVIYNFGSPPIPVIKDDDKIVGIGFPCIPPVFMSNSDK